FMFDGRDNAHLAIIPADGLDTRRLPRGGAAPVSRKAEPRAHTLAIAKRCHRLRAIFNARHALRRDEADERLFFCRLLQRDADMSVLDQMAERLIADFLVIEMQEEGRRAVTHPPV